MNTIAQVADQELLLSRPLLAQPLNASEKLILTYLSQQARRSGGIIEPTNAAICQVLGMSLTTVSRNVNRLARAGHLHLVIHPERANCRTITLGPGLLLNDPGRLAQRPAAQERVGQPAHQDALSLLRHYIHRFSR